jgi:predicted Ser/Thr protein kinase
VRVFTPPTTDYSIALAANNSIPGYEVLGQIHRGGQGVVLIAEQQSTKRTVALKVLLDAANPGSAQRVRFEREVDLAASLHHANIVTIFDSGQTVDGMPFCAMEYIEGVPLGRWARQGGPKPLGEVLRLFIKICKAVNYAHQRGVIHRDLKSNNILVDANHEPHIVDFGLAKPLVGREDDEPVTLTGQFLGTLANAAPEQVRPDPTLIDTRTDIYALGILLYELLTGHFPYRLVGSLAEVFEIIATAKPWPPSSWKHRQPDPLCGGEIPPYRIDEALDAIVLKALAKDRDDRYQSAGLLAEDLQRYLNGEPLLVRPESLGFAVRTWLRRNFRMTLWVLLIGCACGGLTRWEMLMDAINGLREPLAIAQEQFPGTRLPWQARLLLAMPHEMRPVFFALSYFASAVMGILVVFLLRPKNREEDIAAGTAVGLTAALTAFTISSFAWEILLTAAIQPAQNVVHLLAEPSPESRSALVAKYPQLDRLPANEQARYLEAKLIADLVVRTHAGVQVGLWFPLAFFGVLGVGEALIAGSLRRRRQQFWKIIIPYAELVIPGVHLTRSLFPLPVHGSDVLVGQGWLPLVLCVAIVGNWRGWSVLLRLALYLACWDLSTNFGGGRFASSDVLIAAAALLVVVLAELHRRWSSDSPAPDTSKRMATETEATT